MTRKTTGRGAARSVGLVVALALLGAACGGNGGSGAEEDSAPGDERPADDGGAVGDLPDHEIKLPDGTTTTVADLVEDGKPVVLNFFASWCGPCRAEMPDFQAVYSDVRDDVSFFGVALNDTSGAAADLIELTGVTYPWGLDDGQLYAELGGREMPTTTYISADGHVLETDNGAITESHLRSRLSDLFGVPA